MRAVSLLRRASNLCNRVITARYGEALGQYFLSEYPKSGGTWLSKMLADVLDVPCPQHAVLPIGFASVMHNHWAYHPRRRRTVYLMRDGRDVMVSSLFHELRHYRQQQSHEHAGEASRLPKIFGKGFDPDKTEPLLPRYIEHNAKHPLGNRVNWAEHVRQWYAPEARPWLVYATYEQLLEDCPGTLSRVVEELTGSPPELWRVDMAVEKYSIARQTGRKAGQEDRSHFIRKGVAGDWKNHFTRAAAEAFDRFAGDELILLGYERDRGWIDAVEETRV